MPFLPLCGSLGRNRGVIHDLLVSSARWEGAYLVGRTSIGRVTVAVLYINDRLRIDLREALMAEGLFPPT